MRLSSLMDGLAVQVVWGIAAFTPAEMMRTWLGGVAASWQVDDDDLLRRAPSRQRSDTRCRSRASSLSSDPVVPSRPGIWPTSTSLAQAGRRDLGDRAFRADQLSRHYFERFERQPAAMTDLPGAERQERWSTELLPSLLTSVREQTCDAGKTVKTLWRLFDGARVESVLMRYPGRVTMCVSSQAGCGMNCPFCATGQAGLTRNLSTAEVVEQVVIGARHAATRRGRSGGAGRVSNVVFMGMGEPLANYNAVIDAVRRLTDPSPAGMGLSQRQRDRLDRGPGAGHAAPHRRGARRHPRGLACTHPTTSCATRSSRSTPAGRWPRCSMPRGGTPK